MNYADESFYTNTYLAGKAAVITTAFDFYARSATQRIKLYTSYNVDEDNIPDEVKNCCCELAECCYREEMALANNGVSSESVGGWSKSYESSEAHKAASDKNTHDIVYKWLSGTDLLFRGVR
ncbi:MAG: hypothetical protein LKG21_07980 [Ruminococcus sp.]|jgi:hypothetical protein|nr:hypothetical protein [Ruminococcus sp.]